MKIYENIIISNFLFSSGYNVSTKNSTKPFTGNIDLMQQMPADCLLGNLIANLKIEFKESGNHSNKKFSKYNS